MKTLVEQGYENYKAGDPITDDQLEALIHNHKSILALLDSLKQEKYHLFRMAITLDLMQFETFINNRKKK